jgi:chemotaxis protein MotB
MGVFQASTTSVPVDARDPMPFSSVQAIENVERSASIAHIASHPEGGLGAGTDNGDLARLQTELEETLAAEIKRKEIAMRRDPDGLVISLREAGFFESGSAQMKSASQATFDRIAKLLRERECQIRVEGHTDNIPIHNGTFSSNWELSASRATEIVRLLIVRNGYSPARLSAAGYAEFHPVATNTTAEGRGSNRRVDIVILRQDAPRPLIAAVSQPPQVLNTAGPQTARILPKPSSIIGAKAAANSAVLAPRQ